jgi:TonB family protein
VWVYYNESQDTVFATNYNKVLNFILQEENAPINQEPLYLCEIMPEFNGGDPAVEFNKYLSENLNYPAFPMAKGIEGRIIIQFMVDHTGKVRDPQIVRGVQNDLNLEALRVISESPKWTPGKQRNEPTDILYTWPISFQLYKHDH